MNSPNERIRTTTATLYGNMKADKQLTQINDAGHKCDIVINNIH